MLKRFLTIGLAVLAALAWGLRAGTPPGAASGEAPPKAVPGDPTPLTLEELTAKIDDFVGQRVIVEGTVLHLCSVDRTKMKLEGAGGAVVRVDPVPPGQGFDEGLLKKPVRVRGVVSETRIDEARLAELEKQVAVLCHVDRSPCKSEVWVKGLRKDGKAEELSRKQIAALREKLEAGGKGYLSVISIRAETVEIIP